MSSNQIDTNRHVDKRKKVSILGEIYMDIKYMPIRGYLNKYVI